MSRSQNGVRFGCGLFVKGVRTVDVLEKLTILTDAAKYDVACTSSGAGDSAPTGAGLGSTADCGICHTWSADGRCVSLPTPVDKAIGSRPSSASKATSTMERMRSAVPATSAWAVVAFHAA